jgi:hypothetical protein
MTAHHVPTAPVALAELFQRLSLEAKDLARRSDGLQTLLADFTLDGFTAEETMERLQGADALSQRLHDLAAFLGAMTEAAPTDANVDVADASRRLLLSESVQRYGAAMSHSIDSSVEAGDLDLW